MRYAMLLAALGLGPITVTVAPRRRAAMRYALVQVGMKAAEVLAKCGAPTSKTEVSEPVWVRNAAGFAYQAGVDTKEVWRTNVGRGNSLRCSRSARDC